MKIILLNRNYLKALEVQIPQKRENQSPLSVQKMKKRYVTLKFKKASLAKFLLEAKAVQTALSAPMFNSIVPAPSDVLPVITQLSIVTEQVRNGNRLLMGERDALRATVVDLLTKQALAVNYLADGDMNILVQCGFQLDKVATPTPAPERAEVDFVEDKKAGTAVILLKLLHNCLFYELVIKGAGGYERIESSPFNTIKVADLPTGVRLSVAARGVSRKGAGDWSPPVSFTVSIDPNGESAI